MKVFISWSGDQSKKLGEALKEWIPSVLQAVTPYFTPSDIEKGARWSTDIAGELESSKIGILCITRDNLHSDWLLFEAGALSKRMDKSHVCPILFGITNTDLAGPLKQFQTTEYEKSDFQKLITVLNNQLDTNKLNQKVLENVFEKWWPDLQVKIDNILTESVVSKDPIRSDRELLEEILSLARVTRMGPSGQVSGEAVQDLLDYFIRLHENLASSQGSYQDNLDILKDMKKAVHYIGRRLRNNSDDIVKSLKIIDSLDFRASEAMKADPVDEDDIPF